MPRSVLRWRKKPSSPKDLAGAAGALARIVLDVTEVHVVGDAPLVDGMAISVRMRRDFTVTDADRFLAAGRRMLRELHPDVSEADAATMVTCATDALFVVLEHAGLIGGSADDRLAGRASDGLAVAGWRAQVTVNEPNPLPARPDCLRTGDVLACPTARRDEL